jgi:hypothetical protein
MAYTTTIKSKTITDEGLAIKLEHKRNGQNRRTEYVTHNTPITQSEDWLPALARIDVAKLEANDALATFADDYIEGDELDRTEPEPEPIEETQADIDRREYIRDREKLRKMLVQVKEGTRLLSNTELLNLQDSLKVTGDRYKEEYLNDIHLE